MISNKIFIRRLKKGNKITCFVKIIGLVMANQMNDNVTVDIYGQTWNSYVQNEIGCLYCVFLLIISFIPIYEAFWKTNIFFCNLSIFYMLKLYKQN